VLEKYIYNFQIGIFIILENNVLENSLKNTLESGVIIESEKTYNDQIFISYSVYQKCFARTFI